MTACPICGHDMASLLTMPAMPLCEAPQGTTVDQSFTYCEKCSHGKLGTIVPPDLLYGKYAETSKSAGSSTGVDNFAAFIKKHVRWGYLNCIVDIGGNDGSLFSHFPDKRRVSIDPNATGDAEITKELIENADLSFLKNVQKLICCSHTLEHIENPEDVFEKLQAIVNHGDYCAFQFPSLELLVKDCRLDQIYHQHIHYYSLTSISMLLAKHGFVVVAYEFDASHYGALMIVFKKGHGIAIGDNIPTAKIRNANAAFMAQARALNARLSMDEGVIGYGASQMFALLRYYLPAVGLLEYVVDEDESKAGMDFPVEVRHFHNMTGRTVMVTAFNTKMAVRSIVQKLFNMNARDVIVPFSYL